MSKLSPMGASKTPVTDKMKAKRIGKQLAAFAAGGTLVLGGLFATPNLAQASDLSLDAPSAIVVEDTTNTPTVDDTQVVETTPEVVAPVEVKPATPEVAVVAPEVKTPAPVVADTAPQTPAVADETQKPEVHAAISTPNPGSIYQDVPSLSSNLLGAAGTFHVFAENVVPGAHVNGNLAAQTLWMGYGGSEFGTHKAIQKDYAYIQNMTGVGNTKLFNNSTDNWKLVFGEGINITGDSNGNMFSANGNAFHMAPKNLFKDGKGQQYINFGTEFQNLRSTSKTINTKAKAVKEGVINVPKGSTGNSYTIDVKSVDTNYVYVNIDAADLVQGRLTIEGLEKSKAGDTTPPKSVFFNVSFTDKASYWAWSSMVHANGYKIGKHITLKYTDGTEHKYGEQNQFEANTLLWNMNTSDPIYIEGNIGGAILAPDSYVAVLAGSFDGTAAVKKFYNSAETHRWDFQGGDTDIEVPPTKPETPEVPPTLPEDPQGIMPQVPPIIPENPDFPTPEIPPYFPEDPQGIMPQVPPVIPEDPDFPTPEIPPYFPEDPQGIMPQVPPTGPVVPEGVMPSMPPLTPEGITPEVPVVPQEVIPEAPMAEAAKDKLAQTGVDLKVGILAGIGAALVASAGYAASRLRRKENN